MGKKEAKAKKANILCENIEVAIVDSLENSFITNKEVISIIDKGYEGYKSLSVDMIDLYKIENLIEEKSVVKNCDAYTSLDGTLHILVKQREPIIKFANSGQDFYVDKDKFIFFAKNNIESEILTINGKIPTNSTQPKEKEWLNKVINLAKHINNHSYLKNNFTKISATNAGDIILRPKFGKETFLFGSPEDIIKKFELIDLYYNAVIPEMGEDYYSRVDVRYKDQIICKK